MFGTTPLGLYVFVAIVSFLMVFAAINDVRYYKIPNPIVICLLLLFPVYFLITPHPITLLDSLTVFSATLLGGFLLFVFKIFGAGDAKLMAAFSPIAGTELILSFIVLVTLFGGMMAITKWLFHRYQLAASVNFLFFPATEAAFLRTPMPYGVAIAGAAIFVLHELMLI